MISRLHQAAALAAAFFVAAPALAGPDYSASKKAQYPSPNFNAPDADRITLRGPNSTGEVPNLTVGGRTLGSFIRGGDNKTTLTPNAIEIPSGGAITASVDAVTSAPCGPGLGYFPNASNDWAPSCHGAFLSPSGRAFTVFPSRGTARDGSGAPTSNVVTGALIQGRATGDVNVQGNGLFINYDVVGGAFSADPANAGQPNATGFLVSVLMRPDAAGNKPPTTWGGNIDVSIAPGSGSVQSHGLEIDVNNKNQDCGIGAPCIATHIFLNGVSAYSTTAYIYGGGANNFTFTGTATTSGTSIVQASGNVPFNSSLKVIEIGGKWYHVTVVDGTHLTSLTPLPTNATPVAYKAPVASTHNAMLLNGYEQVADNDINLITAAYNAIRIAGEHYVGIDMSPNTNLAFAMMAPAYSKTCFNSTDYCISYVGNNALQINGQGQTILQLQGTTSASADIVQIQNTPQGGDGPAISALSGSSSPVTLRLFGANNGGVKAMGNFYASQNVYIANSGDIGIGSPVNTGLNIDSSTLSIRGATTGGTVFIQDRAGASTYASFNASAGATFNGNVNVTGTYYSNSVAGVDCSGVPTSNFRVSKGIVTRC